MLFERLLKQVALGLGMQLSLAHVPGSFQRCSNHCCQIG